MIQLKGDRTAMVRELFPQRGIVVEVGVATGAFSAKIISAVAPRLFFGIDAWRFLPGEYERDPMNKPKRAFDQYYRMAAHSVGRRANVMLMRMLSSEAAELFALWSLDAVYLDADHTEPGIRADLGAWWPLVRPGGILAGHDYTRRTWIDVMPVVDEFVAREELELYLSGEPDVKSWAVRKPALSRKP